MKPRLLIPRADLARTGLTPVYIRPLLPDSWNLPRRVWLVRPAFLPGRRLPRWTAYRLRTYKTAAHYR